MGAAGQPLRLFQLLQGPHWTLLVYGNHRDLIAPRPGLRVYYLGPHDDVIDAWGNVRKAYGLAGGECVLIRPDGYVGAVLDADQIQRLEIYLANVGIDRIKRQA